MTHEDALAVIAAADSFPALLTAIHQARYTGKLTISFYCGAPDEVELPAPATPPTRIRLGKKQRGLTPTRSITHSIR